MKDSGFWNLKSDVSFSKILDLVVYLKDLGIWNLDFVCSFFKMANHMMENCPTLKILDPIFFS